MKAYFKIYFAFYVFCIFPSVANALSVSSMQKMGISYVAARTVSAITNSEIKKIKSQDKQNHDLCIATIPIKIINKTYKDIASTFDFCKDKANMWFTIRMAITNTTFGEVEENAISSNLIKVFKKFINNEKVPHEFDSKFLLRIPIDNLGEDFFKSLNARKEYIPIAENKSTNLITKLFAGNLLFYSYTESEAVFLLRLRIEKKHFFYFFSPEEVETFPYTYIESMAGVLRSLAIKDFFSDQENQSILQQYSEQNEGYDDYDRIIYQMFLRYDATYNARKEQLATILKNALNQKEISSLGIKLNKDSALSILNLLNPTDFFILLSPVEFWIVNLMYTDFSLTESEKRMWIKSVICAWKSKFFIEHVLDEYNRFYSFTSVKTDETLPRKRK